MFVIELRDTTNAASLAASRGLRTVDEAIASGLLAELPVLGYYKDDETEPTTTADAMRYPTWLAATTEANIVAEQWANVATSVVEL